MCLRSLLSCILTLLTTTTNLSVLLGLHGEPAWIFLLSCNLDVVFLVLIRRWVTLKGPSTTSTSRDVRVHEPTPAALSFSSSQTAQNVDFECLHQELVIDENGKFTEAEVERGFCAAGDKDIENTLSSTHLKVSPTIQTPFESLNIEEACPPSPELFDDENVGADEREESDVESLGRAIITTHISAQKMDDWTLGKHSRHHSGDILSNVDAKFGGIRVLIEQMVEVEYESDLGP